MIYIHGFMGNETSFQSFPADRHSLLSVTLDDLGWYVHTKVYPKFKTRYNISVATEVFSKWLVQFENPGTDVILLSDSMVGILAVGVVLGDERWGVVVGDERRGFRHRIWGLSLSIHQFWGCIRGLYLLGWGVCQGQKGRVLPRRVVQPRAGGCMRAKTRARLRCQRFLPAAWWVSSPTEGPGGISRLCRVSRA